MQDFGVNLISVDDKLDSSTDVGKVMISIMSSMAEMERDNIHAQTMAGRRQKARINKEIDVSELTERLANLQKQLRQLYSRQRHLEQQQDNLDFDAPNFDKMSESSGTLKLMTKKDGTLMANLVNPENNKIVSTISLQNVNLSPALTEAMTNYATQMQIAQIAEEIHTVQLAIEEVRQGQEFDRLATAYSCQQKLLQAIQMKNPELKTIALMQLASAAEDSRNLLMQSQNANLTFIKEQPESFWGKLLSGANPEKITQRMIEIRESLSAVNMVSLIEAMAYQELGESAAAKESLLYYADYLQKAYLSTEGLIQRLDLIDPSPENYWSKTLPSIKEKIQALPCAGSALLLGDNEYES